MARIAGVDLPRDKRVEIGLTYIFGIGLTLSREILNKAGISPDVRVRDLTEDDVANIRNALADYKVEGDLRREESLNIKRLVEIGSYRGRRHRDGLPTRGQRTKQTPVPAKDREKRSQARRLRPRNNVEGGIKWLR